MLNALYVELYKIFHKRNLYIYFIIILAFSSIFVYIMQIDKSNDGMIFPLTLLSTVSFMLFPIFNIIFQTQLFSSELRNGEFKIMLTRPITRSQLLLAKFLALLLFVLFLYLFTFIISFILAGLFMGFHFTLDMENGYLLFINDFFNTLLFYLIAVIPMFAFSIFMSIFTLLIKVDGIIITIGLSISFVFSIVGDIFPRVKPYLINTYFNASEVLLGVSYENQNQSLVGWVIVISYIVFSYFICQWIFHHKDIDA
jgi:ABC-2 type transport system permease protein